MAKEKEGLSWKSPLDIVGNKIKKEGKWFVIQDAVLNTDPTPKLTVYLFPIKEMRIK